MYLSSPGDRIPDEPPSPSRNIRQLFQAVFPLRPRAGGSGRPGGSWGRLPARVARWVASWTRPLLAPWGGLCLEQCPLLSGRDLREMWCGWAALM